MSYIWITCAFCKGTRNDPFSLLSELTPCQVCGGTGEVHLEDPVVKCAFCEGTGVHPHTRISCFVCEGKGSVTLKEPVERCPDCSGKGRKAGENLLCRTCKGKGMLEKSVVGKYL